MDRSKFKGEKRENTRRKILDDLEGGRVFTVAEGSLDYLQKLCPTLQTMEVPCEGTFSAEARVKLFKVWKGE